jgi:hypothetical protein
MNFRYDHLWVVVIIQCIFGAIALSILGCIRFPRPDMVYGIDKSVYLGDFDENQILNP